MSVWTEDNRIYSDAADVETATCEIDLYARDHNLELSREILANTELRQGRHIYLKHVLAKELGRNNLI